jgi:hypothetical protein
MGWLLRTCACTGLIVVAAWHQGLASEPMPRPDGGAVANGVYANAYFALRYAVPAGFKPGLAGPAPSQGGYYVLADLVPAQALTGTVLIAAQDLFFSSAPDDAMATARAMANAMARLPGMAIDRPPEPVTLAGHAFGRLDFSGVGLFRSTFVAAIRCHLVSFNLTANSRAGRGALAASLDKLVDTHVVGAPRVEPMCLKNRAGADDLVSKLDPPAREPAFTRIPVRIVIGADGNVKDVHVIRASDDQRSVIERALGQWKFKPPAIDGQAAEIETGLTIEFRAGGTVAYSGGGW